MATQGKLNLNTNTHKHIISPKYVKAKLNKTQQNSKCWLCDNRNEVINQIMGEYSKLAQK